MLVVALAFSQAIAFSFNGRMATRSSSRCLLEMAKKSVGDLSDSELKGKRCVSSEWIDYLSCSRMLGWCCFHFDTFIAYENWIYDFFFQLIYCSISLIVNVSCFMLDVLYVDQY